MRMGKMYCIHLLCFIYSLLSITISVNAQTDSTYKKRKISFSGSADIYYQHDNNSKPANLRPDFIYNFKKDNRFSSNLAVLKAAYTSAKWRGNLAIMAGNYADYNLASEPNFFRYINEANIGYVFSDKFSIDAGILPSHIGFESAIHKDNWNQSRSLLAENSPYYETGIKFNFSPNEKWSIAFLFLQGWQRIKDNNKVKAAGTQVQYKPNHKWLFNSSTFIGNEQPNGFKQLRLFHNFYATYTTTSKLKTALLFDIGAEKKLAGSGMNTWAGVGLLSQYSFSQKLILGSRLEYFSDKSGAIISTYLPRPFSMGGFVLNLDYKPLPFIMLRTEGRVLNGKEKFFLAAGQPVQDNFAWLSSATIFF